MPTKQNPSRGPRKKSDKKTKRDNDRAARFQQRKRKEEEAASASVSKPVDNPEAIETSSPGAESDMTFPSQEFRFASPVPEELRQDKNKDNSDSMIVSDKKERQEQEVIAPSPLPVIHGEEVVHHAGGETPPGAGPFPFDNITISEHQETASEETESPGLDSRSIEVPLGPPVQSALWVRRTKVTIQSPTQIQPCKQEEIILDMPATELFVS